MNAFASLNSAFRSAREASNEWFEFDREGTHRARATVSMRPDFFAVTERSQQFYLGR
jgi:hypothetical protein